MKAEVPLSQKTIDSEVWIHQNIRDVYNSGQCAKAVELSVEYLSKFPNSPQARYMFAVMHGDYSYDTRHSPSEKQRLLQIARDGLSQLMEHPAFSTWADDFKSRVRNEYYWFFELHQKQYELGVEQLRAGKGGHYSACVGASMLALKLLRDGNVADAEEWARVSLTHFEEFEKVAPDWYNINHFAAQALACRGAYDEALACFKDMYRKQKSPERSDEVAEFFERVDEIKKLRAGPF